jgi:arachidonate 15-lipoxygenase
MGAHLWAAHFAMEAFAVTMHRNLDVSHPLHALLKHHFAELIWNNHLGLIQLVDPGDRVDRLLGTPLAGSMEIMKRARQRWAFDSDGFEADLRNRRMDDYPGTYPYRDDGRRVRDAIATYVAEYVDLYYSGDSRVQGDGELMHWLAELRKWQVAGTPIVATVGDLKSFVTQIIFTSSAYHAAVNYAQYDFMGFIPNMPGASHADPHTEPPSPPNTPPEDQLLPFYPRTNDAKDQLDLVLQLTGYQADRLGDYASQFADPAARTVADRFRAALADLENAMIQDNANRRPALNYYYLCPDLVPNSTSV